MVFKNRLFARFDAERSRMAGFAYFDGVKWVENIPAEKLLSLAKAGVIKPDTKIRHPSGTLTQASDLFSFGESKPIQKQKPRSILWLAILLIDILFWLTILASILVIVFLFANRDNSSSTVVVVIDGLILGTFVACVFQCIVIYIVRCFIHCFDQIELNTRKTENTMRRIEKFFRKE